jgi:hypothetical protein
MTGPDFWATLRRERAAGWGALRDAGPVVEISEADSLDVTGVDGMRVFALSRRCDVLAVLGDPEGFFVRSSRRIGHAGRKDLKITDDEGQPLWVLQKLDGQPLNKFDACMAGNLSWKPRSTGTPRRLY